MKLRFSPELLPREGILLTCSSHEERCTGLISRLGDWRPVAAGIFHYDDENPRREDNHKLLMSALRSRTSVLIPIEFTEHDAALSLRQNMDKLRQMVSTSPYARIILDISVFTKRHLLLMLRWLDDAGYWDRLCIVYCEPSDYYISEYMPLSFGLSCVQQIPGFPACPDLSRALHLVLFLGYEGDRALAVHEHIQPMQTTLVVAHPPYRPEWVGRTERFNADLIALVGKDHVRKVDAIDPTGAHEALTEVFGGGRERGQYSKAVSPLGTKPQLIGIYEYIRVADDPPSIIYASPLRHNHRFSSHGVGETWILKRSG